MPLFYFDIRYYKPSKVINMIYMAYDALTSSLFFSFSSSFFLMWTIFKVFSEFVTMLFLFYVLSFCPQGMWNLCSLIRIKPTLPALEGSLNHRTSKEVPWASSLNCLPVVSLSSWYHSSLLIFIYPNCTSSSRSLYLFSVLSEMFHSLNLSARGTFFWTTFFLKPLHIYS